MEEEEEILELLEIDYSDLLKPWSENKERITKVLEAFGPGGSGLLAISGVPNVTLLRRTLLPFARKLALMDDKLRRHIIRDHGLGTDVSLRKRDRSVSSFAAQLNFAENPSTKLEHENVASRADIYNKQRTALLLEEDLRSKVKEQDDAQTVISEELQHGDNFEGLGNSFKQLGFCMVDVGLRLAQICDQAIGGIELEKLILDAQTAKGRLIHYHSLSERTLLMGSANTKRTKKILSMKGSGFQSKCTNTQIISSENGVQNVKGKNHLAMAGKNDSFHHQASISCSPVASDLWQEWHYDYGIFTVLTAPLFLSSFLLPIISVENGMLMNQAAAQECFSPGGHTYLKILNTSNGKVTFVSVPPSSLIVQVGEAAQILSGGKLHATAHCVCRPAERTDVSRQAFVVFLQPAWNKSLSSPKWFYGERAATKQHSLQDISANSRTEMMHENELKTSLNNLSLAVDEHEPGSVKFGEESAHCTEASTLNKNDLNMLIDDIQKIVPPLLSRWREGQTFAEFSRETTRKYYGTDGIQSNR